MVETLFMAEALRGPKHRSLQGSAQAQVGQNGLRGAKRSKSVKPSSFSQFNRLEKEEQIWIWLSVGHCSSCIYSQRGRNPVAAEAVGKWRREDRCCWHLDLARF